MFEQPTMDRAYFLRLADRFRSPHLWKWQEGKGWMLRRKVSASEARSDADLQPAPLR